MPSPTVFLGDSVTLGGETVAGQRGVSWPTYATIASRQRILYAANAGVGGNTSEQAIDRFDTDVTPFRPSLVSIAVGTNDMNSVNNWPQARTEANIAALVGKARRIGARPILCTLPPNTSGTPTDRKQRVIRLNTWIKRYAGVEGIPVVDFYGLLTNPADGTWGTDYYLDGTHPSNAGYAAMGKLAAQTLEPTLPPGELWVPQDNADANNLLTNGLFLTDANGDGIPDGWNQIAAPGATATLVPTAKGNAYRITATGSTGTHTLHQTRSGSVIVPGNRYSLAGHVEASGLSGATVSARMLFNGSTAPGYDQRAMSTLPFDMDGAFHVEAVAPVDATSIQASLQLNAGSGVVEFSQVALCDLTATGVA